MDGDQICLVASFKAREGRAAALRDALLAMISPTRGEAGCVSYLLHEDREAAGTFTFYEVWADEAALTSHANSPHFLALDARSDDLLSEPYRLQKLKRIA